MNHHLRTYTVALLSLLLAQTGVAQEGSFPSARAFSSSKESLFNVRHIGVNEGLSQGFIYDIIQGQNGLMWFATRDGLNRYDGNSFTIHSNDPNNQFSIPKNEVLSICEDDREWIWTSHGQGQVSIHDPSTTNFYLWPYQLTDISELKSPIISKIIRRKDGTMCLFSSGGAIVQFPNDSNLDKNKLTASSFWQMSTPTFISSKKYKEHFPDEPRMKSIVVGTEGELWAVIGKHLYKIDSNKSIFTLADLNKVVLFTKDKAPINWERDRIEVIKPDGKYLWIGTTSGRLIRFDPTTSETKLYLAAEKSLGRICQLEKDQQGVIWLITPKGTQLFDPISNVLLSSVSRRYDNPCSNPLSMYSSCMDKGGLIWTGTHGCGLYVCDPNAYPFSYYGLKSRRRTQENYAPFNDFTIDQEGNFYIQGARLLQMDLETGKRTPFDNWPKQLKVTPSHSNYLFQQRDGKYWFTDGLALYNYDKKNDQLLEWNTNIKNVIRTGNRDFIRYFFQDKTGQVWVATRKKLGKIVESGSIKWYDYDKSRATGSEVLVGTEIKDIIDDNQGNLWIATEAGLYCFNPNTEKTRSVSFPLREKGYPFSPVVYAVCASTIKDEIFIGLRNYGLWRYNIRTRKFKQYLKKDGLPNTTIYAILRDKLGQLWMSSNRGISCFDPVKETFKNYGVMDGLQGDEFNHCSAFKATDGKMYFGGMNGLTAFYPSQIKHNSYKPVALITAIGIGDSIYSAKNPFTLRLPINKTGHLSITYDQADLLIFDFAATDYSSGEPNQYSYKLDGYMSEWTTLSEGHRVTFRKLAPGNYTLMVRASNSHGIWNKGYTELQITVFPPWWLTWWAIASYFVLGISIVIIIIKVYLDRVKAKNQIAHEQKEVERARALSEVKSNFFSNITHEFRTPLTLILGPVEDLIRTEKEKSRLESQLLIKKHGESLLELVNQLLDINKLENNGMAINKSRGEFQELIAKLLHHFDDHARKRNLSFNFQKKMLPAFYFDANKVERIVLNLISNAVKFSNDGTTIQLRLSNTIKTEGIPMVELEIKDEGIGIAEVEHTRIFERFYQVEEESTRNWEGTGIGLAMCKELAEFMGGAIKVKSKLGEGSCFTFSLPYIEKDETSKLETIVVERKKLPLVSPNRLQPNDSKIDTTEDDTIILIIEDQEDLRFYLQQALSDNYKVVTAANGKVGIEKAIEIIPDLILSDIMMPITDGYEVCNALQDDKRTNHIPIILLTAKTAIESRLKGLENGAIDYLNKPFNKEEMLLRIKNILALKHSIGENYKRKIASFHTPKSTSIEHEPVDFQFTDLKPLTSKTGKEMEIVLEKHMSNGAFDVSLFCAEMNMSRTQLHRKVKAICGLSTTQFIRLYRLKSSIKLLQSGETNVAETCYAVGFNDPSYYTKCFVEQFGIPPTAIIKKKHQH